MGSGIPRRMRRHYRKSDSEKGFLDGEFAGLGGQDDEALEETIFNQTRAGNDEGGKRETMELALREVKKFKDTHKRLPKKEEYEQIAESIFAQINVKKKRTSRKIRRVEARISRKERTGRKRPEHKARGEKRESPGKKEGKGLDQKKVNKALENLKGLDVNDVLGEAKKPAQKKKAGKQEFDELAELSLFGEDSGTLKGLEDETGNLSQTCPNCRVGVEEIIYCPECGTAYCKKCAAKIETLPDRTRYKCPKCGETIEKQ